MHLRESDVRSSKLDVQKQTADSHSSTESEVMSVSPPSSFWDLVF